VSGDDEEGTSPKKKGLGRGLGELLEQHDTDLPFLDAYGPPEDAADDGEASTSAEMMDALARTLRSLLGDDSVKIEDAGIELGNHLTATCVDDVLTLTIESTGEPLPLVPSDLNQLGLASGELAEDRSRASVSVVQWGIGARRLVERLCEHWSLIP
tara:strand:+ start:22 stop:489 length:468 start_codon:yes stop_codon:yes gene_type:complete